eukprot:TRINITY_DN69165_c0_g1_i1.p1 TRINITY_DN69165_c0_g1~~TRINITY_DN69165_c0_g1_i1.p1  ORF type:complete len:128 (-),score=30.27 TRINITY_DN69165_c0_g1_i1:114-461(-)
MYGHGRETHFTRIESRSTNESSTSDKSLIHSLNSGQRTGQSEEDNVWSLTNRIKGSGNSGPDPEYTGQCCRYSHFALGFFGVLLVLFVVVLISIETVRGIFYADSDNSTDSEGIT